MVNISQGWNSKELNEWTTTQGYPWLVALANRELLDVLNVKIQSTKIAIDADGVITYRAGYGKGTKQEWMAVLETLSKAISST